MFLFWLKRIVFGLVGLFALAIGGLYLYAQSVGATVNTPLRATLAGQFPRLFSAPHAEASVLATRLHLPPGFALSVYARDIPGARLLRMTRGGDLLLTVPGDGKVLLLERDRNGDGAADGVRVLMTGLDEPNGLDLYQQYLYVAEQGQVGRVPFDQDTGKLFGKYEIVIPKLPSGGNHYKKTIRFGPDGKLYLAIGSSCNVCLETDSRRAGMMRFAPDGSGGEMFATGMRNSAGFDWRPSDNALFATDNGRDLLGDDFPPCELNHIEQGGFYGWPFVNGFGKLDPDVGKGHEQKAQTARSPVFGFAAHNAPLGILFPRSGKLPVAYQGAALVALHGSWNRSHKDGYKVVALHWDANGHVEAQDFVSGFLSGDDVIGRPAELAEGSDGAIYISDDYAGAVYRVAYGEGEGVRIGGGASGAATASAASKVVAVTATERVALIAKGGAIFANGPCLQCHTERGGATAAGAQPVAGANVVLHKLDARYDVGKLMDYLARPKPPMPPIGNPDERRALAEFLLSRFN